MRKVLLCHLLDSGLGRLIAFEFALRYEGTGRSLSLKLIQQLRQQSAQSQISTTAENKTTMTARLASGTPRALSGLCCAHKPPRAPCRTLLPHAIMSARPSSHQAERSSPQEVEFLLSKEWQGSRQMRARARPSGLEPWLSPSPAWLQLT